MEQPETRYAKTDDGLSIAYQVIGEGPLDIALAPTLGCIDVMWEEPSFADALNRLARIGRLICLDYRGAGAKAWVSEHTLSGETQPNTFVFTYSDGRPVHPGTFPGWFRGVVEDAGLPWRKVHGMRHTHAYVLLNNGWALEKVSRRLGHSSTRVTDHYYGHISRSRPPSRELLSFTAALHAARDVGGSAVATGGLEQSR